MNDEALTGLWCPECHRRVDPAGANCPDCGGVTLTTAHPSTCRDRPRATPSFDRHRTRTVFQGPPVVFTVPARRRSKRAKAPSDPLVKKCVRCGITRKHQDRGNGKPRAYCPECTRQYLREHRARNWKRVKARETWRGIIRRCTDPEHGKRYQGVPKYEHYGGNGVKVCARWLDSFENFLADMGLPPHPSFTIDRRNSSRNYTPTNCRWVHPKTQRANRKNTVWVEARNPETGQIEIQSLSDWMRTTGVSRHTIAKRLKRGWDPDRAVAEKTPRMLEEECPF